MSHITTVQHTIDGSKGRKIGIDYRYNGTLSDQLPIVVFIHGFKGFKDWGHFNLIADAFANAGFLFIKFNGSHNGTSIEEPNQFVDPEAFGHNNFSIEMDDCGLVIDWMESTFQAKRFSLIGHSRGGGIAILKAAEDPRVAHLISWAAVAEFGRYWTEDLMKQWKKDGVQTITNSRTGEQLPMYWQIYEDYFANLNRLHIPSAAKKIQSPWLIVHGNKDIPVPYSAAAELMKHNSSAALLTIENGSHTFEGKHPWTSRELPQQSELVVQETITFIRKNS